MKNSADDPFDLNLCIRGMGVLLTYMHSEIYEYLYFFAFKRSLKEYYNEFNDPWRRDIEDLEFFEDSEDRYVLNAYRSCLKLKQAKAVLIVRFGIVQQEDQVTSEFVNEAGRFSPAFSFFKRSRPYRQLKLTYAEALSGFIACLYKYACALTAGQYRIPPVLEKQFTLKGADPLRLLNHDDVNVSLVIELILGLQQELADMNYMIENKVRSKKPKNS